MTLREVYAWVRPILGPERNFFWLTIIYGVGISVLSLATPLSVQVLINSVANTALPVPLFTLAIVLFLLLALLGLMAVLRNHLMELFRRRFGARLVADITVRAINAANPDFADSQRIALFNRFFDLVAVQKSIPSLLIGAFTLILQGLVGFVVTSFYHPVFLAFNLVVVLAIVLTFVIWSKGAMVTSIELSHKKYAASEWLESVGASDGFYKTADHRAYAIERSEAAAASYVKSHARHYGYTLPQTISLYLIYALASAGLLALGGWLVIQQQLSIGQLVAAELILSGVFLGIAQLSGYLDDFYKLVAAIEELSLLYSIPQEPNTEGKPLRTTPSRRLVDPVRSTDLQFANVRFSLPGNPCHLDFSVPGGTRVIAQGPPSMERRISNLLKRQTRPDSGLILLGDVDIGTLDVLRLRTDVIVLDRPNIVEVSIEDYLALADPDADPAEMFAALRLVGLEDRIAMLPDGLQTTMSFSGYPLSVAKTMQVKLAAAILSRPKVLVLSPLYDIVPVHWLQQAFDHFKGSETTLIHFSNRPEAMTLDGYLWIGHDHQALVTDRADFDALRHPTAGRA
ncbi:ABC transporter ATP-binding protein [Polymorphobacter sp.]|uniref:ABC transporter ATP-binding protein n=1 Tax=Polymorphobacter sp. TaxID=1909290 RepID=UPI003F726AF7